MTIETVLAIQFLVGALAAGMIGLWGWRQPKRESIWCHAMFVVLVGALVPYYSLLKIRFMAVIDPRVLPVLALGLVLLIVPYFVPKGRGMLQRVEIVASLLAILHMAWFVFLIAFLRDFFVFGSIGTLGFGLATAGCLEQLRKNRPSVLST
jgi:hypothetical protein